MFLLLILVMMTHIQVSSSYAVHSVGCSLLDVNVSDSRQLFFPFSTAYIMESSQSVTSWQLTSRYNNCSKGVVDVVAKSNGSMQLCWKNSVPDCACGQSALQTVANNLVLLSAIEISFICNLISHSIGNSFVEWNCPLNSPISNPCDWRGITCASAAWLAPPPHVYISGINIRHLSFNETASFHFAPSVHHLTEFSIPSLHRHAFKIPEQWTQLNVDSEGAFLCNSVVSIFYLLSVRLCDIRESKSKSSSSWFSQLEHSVSNVCTDSRNEYRYNAQQLGLHLRLFVHCSLRQRWYSTVAWCDVPN